MARTPGSMDTERGYRAGIPREQLTRDIGRIAASGSILFSAAALVDSFSHGAITKFYDNILLNSIDLHISTHNLSATRLSIAGFYAAAGIVSAIHVNRHQARMDALNLLAAQESQSDRQATALELSTGQLAVENAVLDANEQPPLFSRTNLEQG